MHYKVVRALTIEQLEGEMQRHLAAGYLPVGGLAVRVFRDATGEAAAMYMQAAFHPEKAIYVEDSPRTPE